MELNKVEIQKLINSKSERVKYESVTGKSEIWTQFMRVKVDDNPVKYVKCLRWSTALKWQSQDGTSSMKMHIEYCAKKVPQTKIQDFTQKRPIANATTNTIPASVKSDTLLMMCAKDIRCVYFVVQLSITISFIYLAIKHVA
jgi:hypothetical protein